MQKIYEQMCLGHELLYFISVLNKHQNPGVEKCYNVVIYIRICVCM